MGVQVVTAELREWIVAQAAAGHPPEVVVEAMKTSGWEESVAVEAIEQTLRHHLDGRPLNTPADALADPGKPMPGRRITAERPRWPAFDREVSVLTALRLPRVIVFGNLLSPGECDKLIKLAESRLVRSETVETQTGASEVNASRTSDGMFFKPGEFAICALLEQRLASLLDWPVENGEGLQILRYRPGAEYKPHFDYFDPIEPGTPSILKRGGQRLASIVCYLNTPEGGGATTFPDAGLEVAPVQGNAVFFSYDRPHPATRSLHGGAPVTAGEKWVATKWLRESRFE